MAAMQEGAGLGLEALSPTEVEKRVEDAACAKAALPTGRCFVSAMLAGAFVAFGGMFFCLFLSDATLPFAVQRLVGGVCFCLGLVLVLCCGAELFTGNVLMVCSRASGRVPWRAVLGNWGLVWLGNLAGSLLAMALVLLANAARWARRSCRWPPPRRRSAPWNCSSRPSCATRWCVWRCG